MPRGQIGMNFPIVIRQLGLLVLLLAATLLAHAGVAGVLWASGDDAEEAALWVPSLLPFADNRHQRSRRRWPWWLLVPMLLCWL